MRSQSPSGALVSPREIPAGSKENGSLAEVRGIEQGGAPQCANEAPLGLRLARGRFPPGQMITAFLPKCEESNRAVMPRWGFARMLSNVGRFPENFSKFPLDKTEEYHYNIKREIWQ